MVQHQEFLLTLARRLCRGAFDAEDLVQDVLLKAVSLQPRLPAEANHVAWMARVMRNLFIDRVRARASSPTFLDLEGAQVPAQDDGETPWWEELTYDDIRNAAARLPHDLRVVFELFAFEHLSYKQIATELAMPIATVGTRVLRARRRLRTMLGG